MSQKPARDSADNLLPGVLLVLIIGAILWGLLGDTRQTLIARLPTATSVPTEAPVIRATITPVPPVAVAYAPERVDHGRALFLTACAACHGQNAQGIQGLGKNLIVSEFVNGLSDDELRAFIIVGRMPSDPLNTTGMPMPARGGNPMLNDANIDDIVVYLRSARAAQDLGVVGGGVQPRPVGAAPIVSVPFEMPAVVAAAAAYADAAVPLHPVYTIAEHYQLSCAGCHGVDGTGVVGYAPSIFTSPLWGDGAAIYTFLTEPRPLDPLTAFPHPVQANIYPALTRDDLLSLIGYLLTLEN